MGFLDGVRDLFPHTVTIEPWTGQNDYGEATFGEATTYTAKIERGLDLARGGRGDGSSVARGGGGDRSIVSRYKVFIGEAASIDARDRLTLDAAFGERDADGLFVAPVSTIKSVMPVYDERELVCMIVYCG